MIKTAFSLGLFLLLISCSNSQDTAERAVGGPCEGCEALYEYGDKPLTATDTFPDFHMEGPKLKITGTIYQEDGKTPASGVILYAYHTDQKGIYPTRGNERNWSRRHGYLRGWIKTGKDGSYAFYTLIPASYPNTTIQKHIHLTVKEPGLSAYYIDDILFEDDPYLTPASRNRQPGRGGPGIIPLQKEDALHVGIRDIVLGENIPGY